MAGYPWRTWSVAPSLLLIASALSTVTVTAADSAGTKDPKQTATATEPIANTAPAAVTPSAPSVQPDPTAAIVAEGHYIYRQRDVDAFVQIASRHAKIRFSKTDEENLRQAIIGLLIAREPLQDAITHLPPSLSGANRDLFVLDVLDYEGELSKAATAPPPSANTAPAATQNSTTTPGSAPTTPAPDAQGSMLIRLPALHLTRTLPALGKRHLTMTIALFFHHREQADKLQDRAPVIQDAILSYVQGIPPALFAEPNQLVLKEGITAAIIAKVPEFPVDAVLIPEMDTTEPTAEAKAGDNKKAP
jgi:flagellar basal body-associated protein FliL